MTAGAELDTLGTQRVTAWGIVLFFASTLLTGGCTWYQFGPALGLVIIVGGIASAIRWCGRRGHPCFTIEHEALVQHFGKRRKSYAWAGMRRPVRLTRKLFQNFLEVRQVKRVPLLISVDDLDTEERQRLLAIVTAVVCGQKSREANHPESAARRLEEVAP